MRPLRLQIRGLRSYRAATEIDFSNVSLMAIVGDTGAGKSSILEAITYALYNATTWDQRSVKQLISDGVPTVAATLDFSVDGRVYRVTRSTSRTQYPSSVHKLECLSDPSIQKTDGESLVNTEIQRLVGLDWKAFVSAVILPQGRFQALLQATPGDRTAILKGIFRLDELTEIRDRADALGHRARARLGEIRLARARLLPDPAGVAKDAEHRRQEAANKEAELRKAQADFRQLAEETKVLRAGVETLGGQAARTESYLVGATEQLRSLVPIAATLNEAKDGLRQKEADARRIESRLVDELASADVANEGREALGRADQILENLAREVLCLGEEADRLRLEADAISGVEEKLGSDEGDAARLQLGAEEAEADATRAGEMALKAEQRYSEARQRVLSYRDATSSHAIQQTLVVELEGQVKEYRSAVGRAGLEQEAAARTREDARVALNTLLRAHAAAHAAEGIGPGDPCPVCARPIPKGFIAPVAPELDSARRAVDHAEETVGEAQKAVTKSQADLAHHEKALKSASVDLAILRTKFEAAAVLVLELIPGADLRASDEDVLKLAMSEAQQRLVELQEKQQLYKGLRSASDRADADLVPRREALAERRARLVAAQAKFEKDMRQSEVDRQALPVRFRPEGAVTQEGIAVVQGRIKARLAELRALEDGLREARLQLNAFAESASALDEEWGQVVEKPRQQAQKSLVLLRERIAEVAPMLGRPAPPALTARTLEEEIREAEDLERAGLGIVSELRSEVRVCREKAESASGKLTQLLHDVGVANEKDLEEAIIATAGTAKQAQDERDLAREQVPKAANLDGRVADGQRFSACLEELTSLLTDGHFIGHVVARKQRALLALASDILSSMTANRYGFAQDFQIVDRLSGQPRPVKTLSGGETFLASLALALGLVELAGRSGGRLDALFLDEGFGSLDANALDSALAELERRASGGRLVAVVSHIRAIAERIETVLSVTTTPAGSKADWITGPERELLVREELQEGLLA